MRRNLFPFLFALLALLLTTSSFADLYTIEANKSPHQVKAQFLGDADVVHVIQPAKSLSLANTDQLSIPLPNGEVWTAAKTDSYATEHGQAWFGELTAFAGGPEGRFMLIALEDGMFLGEFSIGEDHYLIWPHPDSGEHELIQKAPSQIASCGLHDHSERSAASGDSKPSGDFVASTDSAFEINFNGAKPLDLPSPNLKAGSVARLDILPLYHSSLSFTDVRNQYIAWVAQANQVFNTSNIAATYSLVSNPIAISSSSLPAFECIDGLRGSLDWIQGRPDVMMSLRNQYGADFVALAIPPSVTSCGAGKGEFPNDACGVASLPLRDRFGKKITSGRDFFWTQRAFTAVRLGCGTNDLTFAHELGHTLGALHETNEAPAPPITPTNSAAYGYEFFYLGVSTATIMACAHTGENDIYNGNICNRVPHFSSPTELGPGGSVIGTNNHNNRQLIVNKAPSYETFRSRGGPTVQILSPSRHSVVDFQSNHFQAAASEVVNGVTVDLSDQVIWRVRTLRPVNHRDHVILGMGQGRNITNFDFSSLSGQVADNTEFELIAVVEGSTGARASWRIPIQFDMRPPVASFSQSCSTLECDFDASASTAIGGVSNYYWDFKVVGCSPFGGRSCSENATETTPTSSHYFRGYGLYDVTLTVEDSLGRVSSGFTRRVQLTAPSGSFAQVGAWYNPGRSGHGIDLYRNNQNRYVVFWYTYEEFTNKPTWYLSDTAPIINNQFRAPLYRVTRASNGTVSTTVIGNVDLDFSDPTTAAFQWDFTLNGRLAYGWERFEHLYGTNLRTGAWYAPTDSGWGLQINETWGGTNPGSLAALAFYDNSGQPRWVSGFKSQNPVQQNVTIPVNYHVGQNLCPFESCFAGTPSVSFTPAGNVSLSMPLNGNPGNAWTNVTIPGGSWVRNTTVQRLAGY